ncbi:MAG TPA: hypothetical protein IAC60_03665 [Candidatus Enterosoma merdigallinarum]|nr:hypothetical protein [Candidatus Enterosoma merdigallinarum]
MAFIKKFLSTKASGFYFALASLLFGLLALIVYTARGGNSYSPVSTAAVVILVFAVLTNVVVLIKDFGLLAYVPYILYVVTLGVWLNSEMLYLSNVMTAIDNNALDPAWICMVVFLVLAIAAGFAATIMKISKPKNKVETVVEEK